MHLRRRPNPSTLHIESPTILYTANALDLATDAQSPSRWTRSANLLGRTLEVSMQSELIRRFPPSEFPINIDVVGGPLQMYAEVRIRNHDAGIDERVKAVPEEFPVAVGILTAVLKATDIVVAELRNTGRLPGLMN